jgi:hypothetical protein
VDLPDLDALIAGVERTTGDADPAPPDTAPPDPITTFKAALTMADRLRGLADDLVEAYVEHCRLQGYSWAEIGTALGISRQAVQQRYRAPRSRYGPEEFAEEICTAVVHMKESAIRHRNNFIGTDHVLCGLLAENNSAVRLLSSFDIPAITLRQRIENSLTMGASRAAKRFAWTPYTRRALATAHDLASEDGHQVTCAHLLLGLATLGRGAAATVLAETPVGHPAPGRQACPATPAAAWRRAAGDRWT